MNVLCVYDNQQRAEYQFAFRQRHQAAKLLLMKQVNAVHKNKFERSRDLGFRQ